MQMQEQTKKIIDLIASGLTPIDVSKELSISKYSVYRTIKRYKLTYKSTIDQVRDVHSKICQLFLNSDLSLQEIAEQFNCCISNVCQILKKNNIKVPTERKNKNRVKTVQKKYGVDNVMFVPEVIKSRDDFFLNKYGVKNPLDNKKVQQKCKNTLYERYGVHNPLQLKSVQEKIIATNMKRYGGKAPACSKKVREKMSKTNIKRYGIINFKHIHLKKEVQLLLEDKDKCKEKLTKWHYEDQLCLEEVGVKLGLSKSGISKIMKDLNLQVKRFRRSKFEKEVERYLKTIYNDTILVNDRTYKRELDFYIPDKETAIECDGLYYHSFNEIPTAKQKNYHRLKTKLCRDNNIRLFHILECEWVDPVKQQIWKSMLSNNLQDGVNTKLFARKCKCSPIEDTTIIRDFYNYNHLQGFVGSALHIGLSFNERLLSCMSFTRIDGDNWMLTRYATELNCNVVGGASKLFSYFIKNYNPKLVTTFADLRYSYGKLYEVLGFKAVKEVKPRYCYTDCKKLIHRRNFQKKNLQKLLKELYDPNLTEFENVFNNTRYRVIYDAGKIKYEYHT
jgi:predicted DNA-binding protein YlxM (UPF0122 family)